MLGVVWLSAALAAPDHRAPIEADFGLTLGAASGFGASVGVDVRRSLRARATVFFVGPTPPLLWSFGLRLDALGGHSTDIRPMFTCGAAYHSAIWGWEAYGIGCGPGIELPRRDEQDPRLSFDVTLTWLGQPGLYSKIPAEQRGTFAVLPLPQVSILW